MELDPDPAPLMLGGEGQVQHFLMNLLANSLHALLQRTHWRHLISHFALRGRQHLARIFALFFCERTSGRGYRIN